MRWAKTFAGVFASPPHETGQERWLCEVCRLHLPRPVAVPRTAGDEPCLKCLCSREMHIYCRGPFDKGCGMAWTDYIFDDDGQVLQVGLIHCPCDGYVPPAGGRPIASTVFHADVLDEKARIDLEA